MIFLRAALLALTLCAAPAAAYQPTVHFDGHPELRVVIGPRQAMEGGAYVGGQIVLRLQVLSPHRFEALEIVLPEIEGAERIRLMSPRTREVASSAGTGYIHERSVAYFLKRPGAVQIGEVVAIGKVRPKDELRDFVLTAEPGPLKALSPQPGPDGAPLPVATRMELADTLSKPVSEIQRGDLIIRETTLTTQGLRADDLPELTMPTIPGAAVNPGAESRRTQITPDGVIGRATRRWEILIEDPRLVELPELALEFWSAAEHRVERVSAHGWRIEPAAADALAEASALMAEAGDSRDSARIASAAIASLLLSPILAFGAHLILARAPRRADRAFLRAARRARDARALYRAAEDWAAETGVNLGDRAEGRRLAAAVFQPRAAEGAALEKDAAKALTLEARRRRGAKALARWRGLIHGLIGAKTRLML